MEPEQKSGFDKFVDVMWQEMNNLDKEETLRKFELSEEGKRNVEKELEKQVIINEERLFIFTEEELNKTINSRKRRNAKNEKRR